VLQKGACQDARTRCLCHLQVLHLASNPQCDRLELVRAALPVQGVRLPRWGACMALEPDWQRPQVWQARAALCRGQFHV